MGNVFSGENWQGVGLVILATIIGLIVGESAAESFGIFTRLPVIFIVTMAVVCLLSVGAFYVGTRARCQHFPAAGTMLKVAVVPGMIAAIVTTVSIVVGDVMPEIYPLMAIAKWTGPVIYNLWTAPVVIAAIPCG